MPDQTVESIVPGQPEMSEERRELEKAIRAEKPGHPDADAMAVPYVNEQNILVDARTGQPVEMETPSALESQAGVTGVTGVTGTSAQRSPSGDGQEREQRSASTPSISEKSKQEAAQKRS